MRCQGRVRFAVLQELLGQYTGEGLEGGREGAHRTLIPKHIIMDDIMASINYLNCLATGSRQDDIDHLGNCRLRWWASCSRTSSASASPLHGAGDPGSA